MHTAQKFVTYRESTVSKNEVEEMFFAIKDEIQDLRDEIKLEIQGIREDMVTRQQFGKLVKQNDYFIQQLQNR